MRQLAMQAIALIPVLFLHGAALFVALFVYLFVTAGVVTNTSKTRAVESRLSALETVTFPNTGGTISGNVTVTGTHTVNGNTQVGGYITGSGGGTLENNSSIHTSGILQADGQVSTANVYSTGGSTNEFSGAIHTASVLQADSQVVAAGGSGGAAVEAGGGGMHTSGNMVADGSMTTTDLYVSGQRIAPGQGAPGGYPIAQNTPWENQVINVINGIVGGLIAAGIMT